MRELLLALLCVFAFSFIHAQVDPAAKPAFGHRVTEFAKRQLRVFDSTEMLFARESVSGHSIRQDFILARTLPDMHFFHCQSHWQMRPFKSIVFD